jgi:hypothetical protein
MYLRLAAADIRHLSADEVRELAPVAEQGPKELRALVDAVGESVPLVAATPAARH